MYPKQIHSYLQEFFEENDCLILSEQDHYLIVQLTEEMDKKIMNRPFYWQYIESTGSEGTPAQLTLITNKNALDEKIVGEVIHFGAPRLSQVFNVTKEMGSFVCMYEKSEQSILTPWLVINYKVSYYSHRTKEAIHSLGMNLMTGEVFKDFQENLFKKNLQATSSGQGFCLPYIIKPMNAVERLDAILEDYVLQDDHSWVDEAKEKWDKEKLVLDFFYEDVIEKPARYKQELEALKRQYEAKIHIDVINGGLFYLSNN